MDQTLQLPPELQRLVDVTPNTDGLAECIREDFERFERDPEYVTEFLKSQFASDIYHAMEEKKLKPAALARLMGVERQYVTRVLNEKVNFTFETLAKFACALDMRVAARLFQHDERVAILPKLTKPNKYTLTTFTPEKNILSERSGNKKHEATIAA